jgi:hypothetical protein
MLANNVANSTKEEPRSPTYLGKGMTKKNDKKETTPIARKCIRNKMTNTNEEKQTMPWATPRSQVGSNDVNMTPSEIGFA